MKKVLYHANCNDGSAAALAVSLRFMHEDNIEFIPVQYGEDPPEGLDGNDIIMVDFSYKADAMRSIGFVAKSILVLDHHKSAKKELAAIEGHHAMEIHFDMERSGAVMAWEYFHQEKVMPGLFKHIQDRDLWKFEFGDNTRFITKALQLYPDWTEWTQFFSQDGLEMLRDAGAAIDQYLLIQAGNIVNSQGPVEWDKTGDVVPVYNLPGFMISDTLHLALEMYKEAPYAVAYFDLDGKRVYSLRARDGGTDVSRIAERFGGGGHVPAAGFMVSL